MLSRRGYITLHRIAQYGKKVYKGLISNTNKADYIYKDLSYYEQYSRNIAIALWKLEKELKKRSIKSAIGFSTIGTEYEVIFKPKNAGSTACDIFADKKYFISEINCLPEEITNIYYNENGNPENFNEKYIKAFFALKNKDLVFLMSVFNSTLVDMISYIEKNHEMLINDIENGKINSKIKMPLKMREDLERKISPNKRRAKELRKIFAEKVEEPIVPKIWKKMTMIITYNFGEASLYDKRLKKYSGNNVLYINQMYASGRALIAIALDKDEEEYLLAYDSGFYEFIPVDENNQQTLSMDELEIGKLYEIVTTDDVTNRLYKTKDIIKVLGFNEKVPLIKFAYKRE